MGKAQYYSDEYECPVCGKHFICYIKAQWTYKGYFDGEKVLCSWSCMQKIRKEHEAGLKRRKKKYD